MPTPLFSLSSLTDYHRTLLKHGIVTLEDHLALGVRGLQRVLDLDHDKASNLHSELIWEGRRVPEMPLEGSDNLNQRPLGAEVNNVVHIESVADWYWRHHGMISTGSSELDELFGGRGLPVGTMSHIYGPEGSGNTQLCMSLAAHAPLPEAEGGCLGGTIYLDTCATFLWETFDRISGRNQRDQCRLFRVLTKDELISAIAHLPKLLTQTSAFTPRLVIVNNISAPLYNAFTEVSDKSDCLRAILKHLASFTKRFCIAVVVVNDMEPDRDEYLPREVFRMREKWKPTARPVMVEVKWHRVVALHKESERRRRAYQEFPPANKVATFMIKGRGCADYEPEVETSHGVSLGGRPDDVARDFVI